MARKIPIADTSDRETREIDDSVLRGLVGYNLKRAYLTVRGDFLKSLAALNLRQLQFSALAMIADNPDLSQSELAQALSIERSNLVVVIDDLEGRDLITRNKVETDRRTYALRATLKGVHLRDKALAAIHAHEDRLLSDMTREERAALVGVLNRIERGMSKI